MLPKNYGSAVVTISGGSVVVVPAWGDSGGADYGLDEVSYSASNLVLAITVSSVIPQATIVVDSIGDSPFVRVERRLMRKARLRGTYQREHEPLGATVQFLAVIVEH